MQKFAGGGTYPDPVVLKKDFLKCTALCLDAAHLSGVHPSLRDSCMYSIEERDEDDEEM